MNYFTDLAPNILNSSDCEIWKEYSQSIINGDRQKANKKINELIASLKNQEQSVSARFAKYLVNLVATSNPRFKVQHLLFKEIIFPYLIEGYKKNDPSCIKSFIYFDQYFYSDNSLIQYLKNNFGMENFDRENFLDKALQIKPSDKEIMNLLIAVLLDKLDYWVHEFPKGVLVEAETFDSKLAKLKHLVLHSGIKEKLIDNNIVILENISKSLKPIE